MKNTIIIFYLILLLTSCEFGPKYQNTYLKYQNIVILSDMSSRLDNKAPKDLEEIHKIVQFFQNECVKPGEKIGDRSSISFSGFSGNLVASIDLDKIKATDAKQQFVNSTGAYQNNGLKKQIELFEQESKSFYANTRNQGLDLISILIDKIDNDLTIKENKQLTNGVDTTFVNYDNHIYIFTDGYLEYLNKQTNSQFYFGSQEIDKVRKACIATNMDVQKVLQANNTLCLPLNKSSKNQFINLHVYETHERDKDEKLQSYRYSKGQRDNEILEAVWRKWAIESGFKSFEWKKY
jgi:hypothetical protein